VNARTPLLFNEDVALSVLFPSEPDSLYFVNADADDLFYVHQGGGVLRSVLGDVRFEAEDYVFVPRGMLHRFLPDAGKEQYWLSIEFKGPADEGIRELLVKRNESFHGFAYRHSPLDVVGWDGTVYPWAFPILNFQARAGLVHLPPTWHGTFAARGALICSFVPRVVDFHPEAIPCPYPHSSIDVDEFLFYCRGNFTSRRGVGAGSVSHHPAGVAHGPHPGAYEGSIGSRETNELAVMLDCYRPLQTTAAAAAVEDASYHDSFIP
jgi:homogentisate 1,2-dioxygenase